MTNPDPIGEALDEMERIRRKTQRHKPKYKKAVAQEKAARATKSKKKSAQRAKAKVSRAARKKNRS